MNGINVMIGAKFAKTLHHRTIVVVGVMMAAISLWVNPASAHSASHHLYVVKQTGVDVFPLGARGNARPERVLNFPIVCDEVAFDDEGSLFADGGSSFSNPEVLVYGPHASGNAVPKRIISGSNTTLVQPGGIAVDASGYVYVSDKMTLAIDVFAPGAVGNVAPVRIISGPATLLNADDGYMTIDARGDLFLEQGGFYLGGARFGTSPSDQVLEFAANAAGNVSPLAAFVPPRGALQNIAVRNNELYVSANLAGSFDGNGIVYIYSLPEFQIIQELKYARWRSLVLIGAAASPEGSLYALTTTRRSGIWIFPPSKSVPGGVSQQPDGFLGGSRTGFDRVGSDVEIGP